MVVPVSAGDRLERFFFEGVAMSNLIVPDTAKIMMANVLCGLENIFFIDLFKNNHVPSHATVIANLTVADFGGYAQETMVSPVVSSSLDAAFRGVVTWSDVTFTRTSSPTNTIYGYFVTTGSGGLCWVERFDNPVVVDTNGIFIKLTPKLTDKSEFLNV